MDTIYRLKLGRQVARKLNNKGETGHEPRRQKRIHLPSDEAYKMSLLSKGDLDHEALQNELWWYNRKNDIKDFLWRENIDFVASKSKGDLIRLYIKEGDPWNNEEWQDRQRAFDDYWEYDLETDKCIRRPEMIGWE